MKKLFAAVAIILASAPAFATPEKTYRPFRYLSSCALEYENLGLKQHQFDTCVVIETREKGGALRTRNIFSNKFSLTIKGRFDKEKGYMTWDSHNKYEYRWEYLVGNVDQDATWTYVMPGFLVQNVSWD